MTDRKSNALYWFFKVLSVVVSCALPIWAIGEKFPIWKKDYGTTHSIGIGIILVAIVLLIIFRRTVFDFVIDRLDLKHAPPLAIWIIMIVISYFLVLIGEVMRDMTTVFWMGLIGCILGTFLTYISERFKKEVKSDG